MLTLFILAHIGSNREEAHYSDSLAIALQEGSTMSEQEVLLTPSEVAALFRVDPKTVTRWAKAGKLTSIRTLGGHRRYKESEVKALLSTIPGREPEANASPESR